MSTASAPLPTSLPSTIQPDSPKRSASLDLKESSSTEDEDTEFSATEVQPRAPPGIVDVFLGRDRQTLQGNPIVWNQGLSAFNTSVGHHMQGVFTRRFL